MSISFDYIQCPLKRYTFQVKPIRKWVEHNCEGLVLNLYAGETKLNVHEIRNDINPEMPVDYHLDALEFAKTWKGEHFDTIILDPPYSIRKSIEMYNGKRASPFNILKNEIPKILKLGGKVITFGYTSNNFGKGRGFAIEKIALFSHGGAIHDTIASVERYLTIKLT